MKKTIRFLWKYLTDSDFRFWVDLSAYNKFLLDLKKQFEDKQRLSYHKMWGDGTYPPDIYRIKPENWEKYHVNHDGFIQ